MGSGHCSCSRAVWMYQDTNLTTLWCGQMGFKPIHYQNQDYTTQIHQTRNRVCLSRCHVSRWKRMFRRQLTDNITTFKCHCSQTMIRKKCIKSRFKIRPHIIKLLKWNGESVQSCPCEEYKHWKKWLRDCKFEHSTAKCRDWQCLILCGCRFDS